ncbi:MAG: hypothetical protein JF606_16270 [Burkholderiales bacterium]|jgi:hypothetical protein|nr:hypothetical protein [Burkholderiales bacterium]
MDAEGFVQQPGFDPSAHCCKQHRIDVDFVILEAGIERAEQLSDVHVPVLLKMLFATHAGKPVHYVQELRLDWARLLPTPEHAGVTDQV